MDKKIREKLQDPGLSQKLTKETRKIVKKLYLKDLQFAAGILEILIDEDGNTICTAKEQAHFLTLLYGILESQIAILETAKNNTMADIKKLDSKVAEDLINLKLRLRSDDK